MSAKKARPAARTSRKATAPSTLTLNASPIMDFGKNGNGSEAVVLLVGKDKKPQNSGKKLDQVCQGLISRAIEGAPNFTGKAGDTLSLILPEKAGFFRGLIVGVGDKDSLEEGTLETLGGKIFAALKTLGVTRASIALDIDQPLPSAVAAASVLYGIHLRSYTFEKYKTTNKTSKNGDRVKNKDVQTALEAITIFTADDKKANALYKQKQAIAAGVCFARDLVNEAPNILYPDSYARILEKTLVPMGVQVEILDEKKMEKLGFGALLAVGMGSVRPPRLVIMRWQGQKKSQGRTDKKTGGPLAFVGKGVTFDTGGISIKPAAGMEEMKMDMGGSAAVAGLMYALAANKAEVNVVGVLGLAENMPSDRAYRPGDILTSLSGKTIEVLNTDAEGRLVLADALTYVQKTDTPSMIIDLATLTGAIMVALGHEYAGAFVNDDALWSRLDAASKQTGEKLWRMPLDEAFRDEMKGTVTDLKNLGSLGRYGGACSAAGFLEHFIEAKTPWAHIDIAGTAWSKADKPTVPKGGTGFGVRLLYALATAKH